jgi:hypothetical protein
MIFFSAFLTAVSRANSSQQMHDLHPQIWPTATRSFRRRSSTMSKIMLISITSQIIEKQPTHSL